MGKSRLLIEWLRGTDGVYYVADQSAAQLQRSYFARATGVRFPDFDQVVYPDGRSLLERISAQAAARAWSGPTVVDEFPHLVDSDPILPSELRNWLDRSAAEVGLKVVISGSSQRMMQELVWMQRLHSMAEQRRSSGSHPFPPARSVTHWTRGQE